MLVESDTHDVQQCTRLVWAAAVWIGRLKGWKIEGLQGEVTGLGRTETGEDSGRKITSGIPPSIDKGQLEDLTDGDWDMYDEEEDEGLYSKSQGSRKLEQVVWTVRTLERNWARFMRIIDD